MSSILDSFIVERCVGGSMLSRLQRLPKASLGAVEELILHLQPSVNWLRDALDLTEEIAARDKVSLQDTLRDSDLNSVLNSDIGRKDKQKRFRAILEAKRFPRRAQIQRRLKDLQREIARRHGFHVAFPEDLEGDQLTCTLTLRSAEELGGAAQQLVSLESSGRVDEMLRLLRGESVPSERGSQVKDT